MEVEGGWMKNWTGTSLTLCCFEVCYCADGEEEVVCVLGCCWETACWTYL